MSELPVWSVWEEHRSAQQDLQDGFALRHLRELMTKGWRFYVSWNPTQGRYGVQVRGGRQRGASGETIAEAVHALIDKLMRESVDAICTDPPYGLTFMGRDWDDLSRVPERGPGPRGLGL